MQVSTPFTEAKLTKYPELVHIVIVRGKDGICNAMTASWVMFTSIEPPMLAVSIGLTRHTHELLEQSGEFVIAFPSEPMARETEYFGTVSGGDIRKLEELGTPVQPTTVIDSCILSDAVANFECRVKGTLRTGDHTIFAGEIVASHRNADDLKRLYVLNKKTFGGVKPI